VEIVE
jgi:hypothetical protein